MIPKVATHILHHTSRAAAAVQNQTIRNVLQLQSTGSGQPASSPRTGSGSSHWSHNGPGPGGAKFNPNNRFYAGYSGVGRAVTQASIPASHDVTVSQSEEIEDMPVKRVPLVPRRMRQRSQSMSGPSGRIDRAESLGVLKTIQIHARSKHAFAAAPASADELAVIPQRPSLARRNSTSVSNAEVFDASVLPPIPASPTPSSSSAILDINSTALPMSPKQPKFSAEYLAMKAVRDDKSDNAANLAAQAVRNFRMNVIQPTVPEFNMALETLYVTRRAGEPLNVILDTYNDMLKRSLLPNLKTYCVMVLALTDRDNEVQKMMASLTSRRKRLLFAGTDDAAAQAKDETEFRQLSSENNFPSAMSLFQAILSINGNSKVPPTLYLNLLRSCAHHSNVDAAIHVYAQMERRPDLKPSPTVFLNLMSVYINSGNLQGAKTIFAEFRKASDQDRMAWMTTPSSPEETARNVRAFQVQVWNRMLEAYFRCGQPEGAISLLEEMMDSKADPTSFTPKDIPPPASSTFTQIISGFCAAGDIKSALVWFDRLLAQPGSTSHPLQSVSQPPRPDIYAWHFIFEHLASEGMVDELNRLFKTFLSIAERDAMDIRPTDRALILNANFRYAEQTEDTATMLEKLDFVMEYVLVSDFFQAQQHQIATRLVALYLKHGQIEQSVDMINWFVGRTVQRNMQAQIQNVHKLSVAETVQTALGLLSNVFDAFGAQVSFPVILRIMHILDVLQVKPPRAFGPYLLHAYALAKQQDLIAQPLDAREWAILGYAASSLELPSTEADQGVPPNVPGYAFQGTASLLADMAAAQVNLDLVDKETVRQMLLAIQDQASSPQLKQVISSFGPNYAQFLEDATQSDAASATDVESFVSHETQETLVNSPVIIDMYHNRTVDEFFHVNSKINVHTAYQRFQAGLLQNKYPTPITIGHLITALGRLGEIDKVRYLYSVAQKVLGSLEENKKWQAQSWFVIEDAMIVALAHAGDLESAHVHRTRMLQQGGAPTADAYGALIQYVKDTTDDTSSALALFQEAEMQNVRPNIYLYNNIISKLAKARKADYALELFQQMKVNRIQPSSITYGALIAACARVGDHQSAEELFQEMTQQRNFKPRIPPYNTMMQLYTSTKPNRERALYYYDALRSAGVHPSAHTYKLLIDAYGTVEPLDLESVQRVFKQLEADPKVEIQGSHWAAVINAYGCANKDLNKAMEIFDSIATHPKTLRSSAQLPDAVCFEAMVNVLVMHRQTELMAKYIQQLHSSGVHMTAYIANFLIKGHAIIGDLERSRSIFESLHDPPVGVAAPNNHVPHDPSVQPSTVNPALPVYREPSTWEVMVRAELGAGNRDNALALLERLRTRHYPEAVYNRISGIMLDDSVSPWADTYSVHSQ